MPGRIESRVLEFLSAEAPPEPFEGLALAVHAHQLEANPAYRRWVEASAPAVRSPASLDAIPAVPTAAFKELELSCGEPEAEFRTSGTTGSGPGRHLTPSLAPYRAAALREFKRRVLADAGRMRTLVLVPPPELRPASSLSRMLAWVLEAFGAEGSGWFVGPGGLERDRLADALRGARREGAPVLLAGTSAAVLAFLDHAEDRGLALRLPEGSRLMDTGGRKGTGRTEVPPLDDFQREVAARAARTLGVPASRCVNEYGMTELSSQFYDVVPPDGSFPRVKAVPPWVRVIVRDPVTLDPCPPGAPGLLQFLDLANVGSVMSVLTEDLGRAVEGGFLLAGRPSAAEARGCGLSFEELAAPGRT